MKNLTTQQIVGACDKAIVVLRAEELEKELNRAMDNASDTLKHEPPSITFITSYLAGWLAAAGFRKGGAK